MPLLRDENSPWDTNVDALARECTLRALDLLVAWKIESLNEMATDIAGIKPPPPQRSAPLPPLTYMPTCSSTTKIAAKSCARFEMSVECSTARPTRHPNRQTHRTTENRRSGTVLR